MIENFDIDEFINSRKTGYMRYYENMRCPYFYLPPLVAPDEIFKIIGDLECENVFPDRYAVSNYGRVFDVLKYEFLNYVYTRLYHQINLATIVDNKIVQKNILLHRLVMLTFCYRPDYKNFEVNHLNGNHLDNRLCNLEWCTTEENTRYAIEHGQYKNGEEASRSILTNEQAEIICKMLESGMRTVDIANKMGLEYYIVKNIKQGTAYKYISVNYNIPKTKPRLGKLPDETVIEIAKRLGSGESITDISRDTGIAHSTICSIKSREHYSHLTSGIYMGETMHVERMTNEEEAKAEEFFRNGLTKNEVIKAMENEFGHEFSEWKMRRIQKKINK